MHQLCSDLRTHLDQGVYGLDEIAARFSHRLVSIHPFANGNGLLSRNMADLLLVQRGAPRFSRGAGDLQHTGSARQRYLEALGSAHSGDFTPLLAFVRS